MKAVGTLVLFLAVAIVLPMQGVTNPGPAKQIPAAKKSNVEIEIARKYAQLGDWSEAEAHFLAAAKDPDSQAEALAVYRWTPEGYGARKKRPRGIAVDVLTPPAMLAALSAGYKPQWHFSAGV